MGGEKTILGRAGNSHTKSKKHIEEVDLKNSVGESKTKIAETDKNNANNRDNKFFKFRRF